MWRTVKNWVTVFTAYNRIETDFFGNFSIWDNLGGSKEVKKKYFMRSERVYQTWWIVETWVWNCWSCQQNFLSLLADFVLTLIN